MKRRRQFRIPTLFAFVLLAVGIGLTMFFINRGTFIVTQATPDYVPKHVAVSNIGDSSFAVSFTTTDPTVGGIKMVADGKVILSETSSNGAEGTTHYITVEGVEPAKSYDFVIISDEDEYMDNGAPYKVTTAPNTSSEIPKPIDLTGQVLLPSGGGAPGAIVYLSFDNSQLMSTLTDGSGKYTFSFPEGIRTSDLKGFYVLEERDLLDLLAVSGDLASELKAYYGPVLPPITLSHNFDFTASSSATIQASGGAQLVIPETQSGGNFAVLSPLEGATLIDAQPSIRGTGTVDTMVFLEFEPSKTEGSVMVDEFGRWEYRVEAPLPQGSNTLKASGVSSDGIGRQEVVVFDVFPSGSQIQQTATPSATPKLTITPSLSPSPTLLPSPTVIPTVITPSPTLIASASPTLTPTPTMTPTPTITPFLKVTPTPPGNIGGVILTFTSLAFIVGGAALLFLLG